MQNQQNEVMLKVYDNLVVSGLSIKNASSTATPTATTSVRSPRRTKLACGKAGVVGGGRAVEFT